MLFFAGYLLMSAAPNIWALIPSTIVRSVGSSVVWVYSTLLIQLRVPNQLQGRMMALEMAAYVVRLQPDICSTPKYHITPNLNCGSDKRALDALHASFYGLCLRMQGTQAADLGTLCLSAYIEGRVNVVGISTASGGSLT